MMQSETTIGFQDGFRVLVLLSEFVREPAMRIDKDGESGASEVLRRSAHSHPLPKQVRLRAGDALAGGANSPGAGVYEFEVVTGNAAYREGERFYLTPAQAARAYFSDRGSF
jgi:hypothetical protein